MIQKSVKVEYITREYLKRHRLKEIIEELVQKIVKGSVIVLEEDLPPQVQTELIIRILNFVDTNFFGIDLKRLNGSFSKRKVVTVIYPKNREIDLNIYGSPERFGISIKVP